MKHILNDPKKNEEMEKMGKEQKKIESIKKDYL